MKSLNVVVAGASGLIGRAVLNELSKHTHVTVTALVRKPGLLQKMNLQSFPIFEEVFNYENSSHIRKIGSDISCDIFLCCLGSTIKTAGSQEAFKRIEHDYPITCLDQLKQNNPSAVFSFVSSMGAGKPRGFYLKNKRAVEQKIEASGIKFVIVRPSLLLGERKEFRLGERLTAYASRPIFAVVRALQLNKNKIFSSVEPIEAHRVAKHLVESSLNIIKNTKPGLILENHILNRCSLQ